VPPGIANEAAAAAMTFLGGTAAIIFDVRQNGGGSPEMVAFLTSYLFEGTVHLNDLPAPDQLTDYCLICRLPTHHA
jgi:hypothetical protein